MDFSGFSIHPNFSMDSVKRAITNPLQSGGTGYIGNPIFVGDNAISKIGIPVWTSTADAPGWEQWKQKYEAFCRVKGYTVAQSIQNLMFWLSGPLAVHLEGVVTTVLNKKRQSRALGTEYDVSLFKIWEELDNIVHGNDHCRTVGAMYQSMTAKEGESFSSFYSRVMSAKRKASNYDGERTKSPELKERELIQILRAGAPRPMRDVVMSKNYNSVAELVEYGYYMDREWSRKMGELGALLMDDPDVKKTTISETTTYSKTKAKKDKDMKKRQKDGSGKKKKSKKNGSSDEEEDSSSESEDEESKEPATPTPVKRRKVINANSSQATIDPTVQALLGIISNHTRVNAATLALPAANGQTRFPDATFSDRQRPYFKNNNINSTNNNNNNNNKSNDNNNKNNNNNDNNTNNFEVHPSFDFLASKIDPRNPNPYLFPGGTVAESIAYREAHRIQNVCGNCRLLGHYAKNCTLPCSLCGSSNHTKRNCPTRGSFANN